MPQIDIATIRARLPHYLSEEIAASAGLTLRELQQVIAGAVPLQQWQLDALARRMGVSQ